VLRTSRNIILEVEDQNRRIEKRYAERGVAIPWVIGWKICRCTNGKLRIVVSSPG
jgi:hypothetical protein